MKKKYLVLIALGIIALIQVIRIDTVNPEINPVEDFLVMAQAPPEIADIVKTSCYDCHSYQTHYPWYSQIAPVSWFLKNHINEGREHMNFSKWAGYPSEKQISMRKECAEEIKENGMPLKSYTIIHSDAKITAASRQALIDWLNQPEKANASLIE